MEGDTVLYMSLKSQIKSKFLKLSRYLLLMLVLLFLRWDHQSPKVRFPHRTVHYWEPKFIHPFYVTVCLNQGFQILSQRLRVQGREQPEMGHQPIAGHTKTLFHAIRLLTHLQNSLSPQTLSLKCIPWTERLLEICTGHCVSACSVTGSVTDCTFHSL